MSPRIGQKNWTSRNKDITISAVYRVQIWQNTGRGLRISGYWSFISAPQIMYYTISITKRNLARRSRVTAEMPAVCCYNGWPHLEQREGTEVVWHHFKQSIDLIMRFTLNGKSPRFDTYSAVHRNEQSVHLNQHFWNHVQQVHVFLLTRVCLEKIYSFNIHSQILCQRIIEH